MVTVDDVRALAETLPRSYEVLVRDRVKFRVGQMVYVAFSRDEQTMGFGFPKEERAALVASEPDKFLLPPESDLQVPLGGRAAGGHRRGRDARSWCSAPGGWWCRRRSPGPVSATDRAASA